MNVLDMLRVNNPVIKRIIEYGLLAAGLVYLVSWTTVYFYGYIPVGRLFYFAIILSLTLVSVHCLERMNYILLIALTWLIGLEFLMLSASLSGIVSGAGVQVLGMFAPFLAVFFYGFIVLPVCLPLGLLILHFDYLMRK